VSKAKKPNRPRFEGPILLRLIEAAMQELENTPQGGIGAESYTRAELEDANRHGTVVENDAEFHQVQSAWLYLAEARKELNP